MYKGNYPKPNSDAALQVATLVEMYARTKDPELLVPIVNYHMPFLVNMTRYAMRRQQIPFQGPVASFEDYLSAAKIAFIESLNRFSPKHGKPLNKFASPHVYGAVVDEYRERVAPLVRSHRRIHSKWVDYVSAQHSAGELADVGFFSLQERVSPAKLATILGLVNPIHLDERVSVILGLIGIDGNDDPSLPIYQRDTNSLLRKAISALPERERILLEHRLRGVKMGQIAESGVIGHVNESRVSQLHAIAIGRLRDALNPEDFNYPKKE